MNPNKTEISKLRHAKETLQKQYGEKTWFRGVGIAPSDHGLVLRLNIDDNAQQFTSDEIPEEYQGYKLEIVHISNYKKRGL